MEDKIIQAYVQMVNSGTTPINAYTVAERAGISETEFYTHFPSAEAVGSRIWLDLGKEVAGILQQSEAYRGYPARQKVLAYYFTFFEAGLKHRMFIRHTFHKDAVVRAYKEEYKQLMSELVQEGLDTDDMKNRLTLSNHYPRILWELHQKLVRFWLRDQSEGFTQTEKAIESYSRLPLDFMGPNLIDSVADTLKFELERHKIRVSNPFKMS
ncbi:MAG: hypothetical protein KF690_06990 [Bacteroidetes bacterium]|nr:hypothetical protein [Bacteroidota bacterium]